ncbi:MAG: hypothetical protein A3K67_07915 [Euryarchaeota archaeon RBG_16_62_10]|nr:MAG: hypothetical protein A3K67_07915 [Euryarchaeota archaeon RBG_16_62_10]
MKNLEKVVGRIESELDEKDQIREIALKSSRLIVRLSGRMVRSLHKEKGQAQSIEELREEVSKLSGLLSGHEDISNAGYVQSALQEYSEAMILMSILENEDVPSPQEIGAGNVSYLLGLGDSVGELRRLCLESLREGDVKRAGKLLDVMEEVFSALMRFDYPDAIVPLRHKQDVARSVIEKTRGDVAVAVSTGRLENKLDEVLRKE